MKVVFYSPDSSGLFIDETEEPVGGAEVRMYQFAKYLSNRHFVKVLFHHRYKKNGRKEGVNFCSVDFHLNGELPIFKRLYDRCYYFLNRLQYIEYTSYLQFKELISFKPDIVCLFGLTSINLKTTNICRLKNIKVILFIASDEEITFEKGQLNTKYSNKNRSIADRLIAESNICFVQNDYQYGIINKEYNKNAVLLRSPITIKAFENKVIGKYVLWVGKDVFYKQPEIYFEIAKGLPSVEFVMICNKINKQPYTFQESAIPDNLKILEFVPYESIDHYFEKCTCFVNTSLYEGFPNTFLSALKFGKPLLSLNVNPNNFITEEKCGICTNGNVPELMNAILNIYEDKDKYLTMSNSAFKYIKNHDISAVGDILEQQLSNIL